jgi:CcmD family protein
MRLVRFAVLLIALTVPGYATLDARQQTPPKPPPQDEFVPLDQLPPQQELPAAPMVVAAYSFVWVAFVGYMFLLVKRVQRVEADLRELERRSKQPRANP